MTQLAAWVILLLPALPLTGVAQQSNQSDKDTARVFVIIDSKKPTKMVKPSYPESAMSAGIQGKVVFYVYIGENGQVYRVEPRQPRKRTLVSDNGRGKAMGVGTI